MAVGTPPDSCGTATTAATASLHHEDSASSSVDVGQPCETQASAVSSATASKDKPAGRSDMETHVRVVARFRPPVTDEEFNDQPVFLLRPGDNSNAIDSGVAENATVESQDGRWTFEFDTAFSEEASQHVVYDRIGQPAVQDVLAGYNGTILTYGQTGSGKTFTLFGPSFTERELRGLAPRAAEQLVQQCLERPSELEQVSIYCTFLEIYRERMRDLLHPSNQSLRIKEIPQRGLIVDGLTQDEISSTKDVFKALNAGNAWRSVAATRQNQYSSRSHAIFTIYVSRRCASGSNVRERSGKLSLVDLAGSERVSRSHCVGETLEEAKKINSSLTALGKVIDALVERRGHIPYRDSTLTRVLEEALGGNSRTTLLVAASACAQYLDETICSLRFASRAQKVSNFAQVNFVYSAEELLPLVSQLQRELAAARRELAHQSLSTKSLSLPRARARTSSTCSTDDTKESFVRIPLPKCIERDVSTLSTGLSRHSTLSAESPRSEQSSPSAPPSRSGADELEDSASLSPPQPSSEALAQSAAEALRCLEEMLLAQEEALEKAQLLSVNREARPSRQTSCSDPASQSPVSPISRKTVTSAGSDELDLKDGRAHLNCTWSSEGENAFALRWRCLRHAVEARALRWRLQRERHRAESMQYELQLRNRYTSDLERRLEAAQAELTLLRAPTDGAGERPCDSPTKRRLKASKSMPRFSSPSDAKSSEAAPAMTHAKSLGVCTDARDQPDSPTKRRLKASRSVPRFAPSTPTDASPKPTGGAENQSPPNDQLRALREAQCALRGENLELKQEAAKRERYIAALAADNAASEVRVAALKHESSVKDAMLACLRKEAWQPPEACDEELEKLLAAVATPLLEAMQTPPTAPVSAPLSIAAPPTVMARRPPACFTSMTPMAVQRDNICKESW